MKALDPALAAIAAHIGAPAAPSLFEMEPIEARAIFDSISRARSKSDDGVTSEDTCIVTDGRSLPLRIYLPRRCAFGATTVFLHGGGYMLGGIEQMDSEARMLCAGIESTVVAVDYRLAPEHPLPAAHADAVAALTWAYQHAGELGGDPAKVSAAGESAGANLAASAVIALRDSGVDLCAQLLIVPAPDLAAIGTMADDIGEFPILNPVDLRAIAKRCLPALNRGATFPYSAAYAARLEGLPPAVIGLAGHCPTREIGRKYSAQLAAAGNEVHVHEFEDLFHPFFAFADASASARQAVDVLFADFRAVLAR